MIDVDLLASIDGRTFIAFELETGVSLENLIPAIHAKQANQRPLTTAERIIVEWLHVREDAPVPLASFAAAVKPFALADAVEGDDDDG